MQNGNKVFNGAQWYQKMLLARTNAELARRNQEFQDAHQKDSKEELIRILRDTAQRLGHSPMPEEMIGGAYIKQRCGSWRQALRMAGLPQARRISEKDNALFQEERSHQAALYREEKAQKQAQKLQKRLEREARQRSAKQGVDADAEE